MTENSTTPRRILVTGASSGIGAATARRLVADGNTVLAVARRADRLQALADEIGVDTCVADITQQDDVDALVAYAESLGGVDAVVNNAGCAFGQEPVWQTDPENWRKMYDVNVLGTLRVTQGFLPMLRARGGGDLLFVTSTAAYLEYEGGAGYTGAKHALKMLVRTLRLELVGEPIRVLEVAPGMVHTAEFSSVRFDGDQARADAVYKGMDPLVDDDIADAIAWMLSRPTRVNVDTLIVRPVRQASNYKTAPKKD